MKKILKVLLIIVLILALIAGAAYVFLINKFSKINYQELRQESPQTESEEAKTDENQPEARESAEFRRGEDVINILLIGADNNWLPGMAARGNADGIIILSLNKNTEKIIISSIQRDTLISLPDNRGSEKATLMYHNYGPAGLIEALEYSFKIKIDNYVMVTYPNVVRIIDAAGGVDVEIEAEVLDELSRKIKNINYLMGLPEDSDLLGPEDVGMQHLNGRQAAGFMRLRLTAENDFGRTKKIRIVLSELKKKMTEMSLPQLNSFADTVLENISSDLSTQDLISLLAAAPGYIKYETATNRIPLDGSYYGDGGYIYPDMEVNIKALHEAIYG